MELSMSIHPIEKGVSAHENISKKYPKMQQVFNNWLKLRNDLLIFTYHDISEESKCLTMYGTFSCGIFIVLYHLPQIK